MPKVDGKFSSPTPPAPTPVEVCPVCRKPRCYHCWTCKEDLAKDNHKPDCPDAVHYECLACLDTLLDSTGKVCHPCLMNGRVPAR